MCRNCLSYQIFKATGKHLIPTRLIYLFYYILNRDKDRLDALKSLPTYNMSHFCSQSWFLAKTWSITLIGPWAFKFVKHLRRLEFKRFDWQRLVLAKHLDREQKCDMMYNSGFSKKLTHWQVVTSVQKFYLQLLNFYFRNSVRQLFPPFFSFQAREFFDENYYDKTRVFNFLVTIKKF